MILGSRRRRSGGNSNVLTFWTTCDNTSTFDPKITGVNGIWRFDDGSVLVGTSGVEISKTFASGGLHWAKFYPGAGGLGAITAIDADVDLITLIINADRCLANTRLVVTTNSLACDLSTIVSPGITYINIGYNTGIVGGSASLPRGLTWLACSGTGIIVEISELPLTLGTYYHAATGRVYGSVGDLPASVIICQVFSESHVTTGDISRLVLIRDLRIYSMGWLPADVDTVLLSVSDALWANLGHFTYATPALQIGGTNQAPGGTIGAATTSPLVTPGAGNSDADWLWVEGVSEHYPISGCAAVYYMRNNVGHAWAVTITGEA